MQCNLMPPGVIPRLFATALKHGIEVDYVRQLIHQLDLTPRTTPYDIPNWPWLIKIFTLGKFEVLVEDKPVEMTRMKKNPLLLLKAIVALGGENVRVDTLSEQPWPDADGDTAYDAFRTTLHRLRRLLGSNKLILSHEGVVSLDIRRVWIDTWALERIRSIASSSEQDIGELFRQIRQLFQGEFLPQESDFWMISPRERIRDQFLRLVARFGEALEKKDRWQEAVACNRACLDTDDLSEQIYQRLMSCYWRLGDKSAAASTYTRLRKTLKSQLDVEAISRHRYLKVTALKGQDWKRSRPHIRGRPQRSRAVTAPPVPVHRGKGVLSMYLRCTLAVDTKFQVKSKRYQICNNLVA